MELKNFHRDLIDDVMDNFDFEKVAEAMKALDWKWATDEGTFEVPDTITLRRKARKMLKEVITDSIEKYDGGGLTIGTGGFQVYYNENEKYLELKFVLTDWNAYVDDDGSITTA